MSDAGAAAPSTLRRVERDGFLAVESDDGAEPLTATEVRDLLEQDRR